MCGVVGIHAPGQEAAGLASLALFALQHRGQESAGVAVSDGDGVMVYKDLGMVAQVLDERRLPSLRGHLAIAHCRYSTTGSTLWENSQPAYRLGPQRTVAVGPQRQPRQHAPAARAPARRPPAHPRLDRHRAAHGAPLRRARRRHRGGAADRAAAGLGRLLAGGHGRAARHRRARPTRLPSARPGPHPRRARGLGGRLGDGRPRHPRRRGRARRRAGRDGRPGRARRPALDPLRRGDRSTCASSSSSTSRGPTRTSWVATSTRPAGGWARRWHARRRSTPTRSCRCPTPAPPRRPATPRPAGCPTARAWSRTATPAGPSSSPRRRCASGAWT